MLTDLHEFTLQLMLQDAKENTLPLWGGNVKTFDNLMTTINQEYQNNLNKNLSALKQKITYLNKEILTRTKLLETLNNKSVEDRRILIKKELKANKTIMINWSNELQQQIKYLDDCQKKAKTITDSKQQQITKAILKTYGPLMNQSILKLKEIRSRQNKLIPGTASIENLDKAFQNKLRALESDQTLLSEEVCKTKADISKIKALSAKP